MRLQINSHYITFIDFWTCSGVNLPNSSCHFWKYKSVFLQILYQCSVSSKITPLYFFSSNILYFGQKQLIKVQIFEIFECSDENLSNSSCHWLFNVIKDNSSVLFKVEGYILCTKGTNQSSNFGDFWMLGSKFTKFLSFWNNKSVFLQILHQSSGSWDINPLYFISWNFMYFQQKEPIKVQLWWSFTWAVGIFLKFCTLMGSFCKNHIKFQLKKYRRVFSHDTEEWCKV